MKRLSLACMEDCRIRASDNDVLGCGHCEVCWRTVSMQEAFNLTQERLEELHEPRPNSTN